MRMREAQTIIQGKCPIRVKIIAIIKKAVSIPKTNENIRLLYDTKGRFRLHSIRDDEAKFGPKGIPYLNTYDGRTIHYPDPLIRANDTVKLDLEKTRLSIFIKFDVGNVVMVTGGRNRGCVGVIKNREKHKGSFKTIHVQDATGHEFASRMGNVFTIGKGTKPWISLAKGKGIKLGSNSVNILVPIDCSPKGKLVEMNTQCAHADNGCGSCSYEDNSMNEPILNSKLEAVTYV
ncbi:hypothetical protein JHK84_047871 [Glycine max]|nr:hypothetical protein JHK84_047871 [Glycine max]